MREEAVAMMRGIDVSGWFMDHWPLTVFVALFLLLVAFCVAVPLLLKARRAGRKAAETADLRKELRIWDNLAALVRGGDKGRGARERLSGNLRMLTMLFDRGMDLIRSSKRGIYDMPWYLLLGEPRSGKSSLLADNDIGFVGSVTDGVVAVEDREVPLRCWLGAKSYIMDVSGKVFFDRWLDDSGAEWLHFVRLVRRRHARMPLSGILLAIPVDALLTDSPQLTRQKLDLLVSELQQLLVTLGQRLPCQVVVTKMDMLTGFREYFADADAATGRAVFGWENPDAGNAYRPEAFADYFDRTYRSLRDAVGPKMMDGALFRQGAEASRLDATGNVYLFPESFRDLHQRLEAYLNRLFSLANWHGAGQLMLSGVFFASGKDKGVTLSRRYAELCGKPVEDAVVTAPRTEKAPMFVEELLVRQVHRMPAASFMPRRQFLNDLPGYGVCCALLGLAGLWTLAPVLDDGRLRQELEPMARYYTWLSGHLGRSELLGSPLLGYDPASNRTLIASDKPLEGVPNYGRLSFLYDAQRKAGQKVRAPFGFVVSGRLLCGLDSNLFGSLRERLFTEIWRYMVAVPVVDAVVDRTIATHDAHASVKEPFDQWKRDMMFAFCNLAEATYPTNMSWFAKAFDYVVPDVSEAMRGVLGMHYDDALIDTPLEMVNRLSSPDYMRTEEILFSDFFDAWKNDDIYPESLYPQYRRLHHAIRDFIGIQDEIDALGARPRKTEEFVQRWRSLMLRQQAALDDAGDADRRIREIVGGQQSSPQGGKAGRDSLIALPQADFYVSVNVAALAERDYVARLDRDLADLAVYEERVRRASKMSDRAAHLVRKKERLEQRRGDLLRQIEEERREFARIGALHVQRRCFHEFRGRDQKGNEEPVTLALLIYQMNGMLLEYDVGKEEGTPDESAKRWNAMLGTTKSIQARIEEMKGRYESPGIPQLVRNAETYMSLQTEVLKRKLTRNIFDRYAAGGPDLTRTVDARGGGDAVLGGLQPLAEESVGRVTVKGEYSPEGAERTLAPLRVLLEEGSKDGWVASTDEVKGGRTVRQAVELYVDGYLDYWGGFGDAVSLRPRSWAAFRGFCDRLKPYEVNGVLRQIYSESLKNLFRIPDAFLTERQKARRTELKTTLEARIQSLTPHFSEICIAQVNAWATLPSESLEAYKALNALPARQARSEYLAVLAAGNRSDIPWWDGFFRTGAELLKQDVRARIFAPFGNRQGSWLRFPLCADSFHDGSLTREDLVEKMAILKDVGFVPAKGGSGPAASDQAAQAVAAAGDAVSAVPSFGSLNLAPMLDKRTRVWGEDVLTIADALVNPWKELAWTISRPDADARRKLTTGRWLDYPDASVLYRYWNIRSGGRPVGQMVSTASPSASFAGGVGGSGAASDAGSGDIELCFYAFAGDTVPAAVVRFAGPWAVLRLYLLEGGVGGGPGKPLSVPVVVRDRLGQSSLFWLDLTLNKDLPLPGEWPSMRNWPFFSEVQAARAARAEGGKGE